MIDSIQTKNKIILNSTKINIEMLVFIKNLLFHHTHAVYRQFSTRRFSKETLFAQRQNYEKMLVNRYKESKLVIKRPARKSSSASRSSEKDSRPNSEETADVNEKYKYFESKARVAINAKKIFTIIGGFDVVRKSLLERGWVEKYTDNNSQKSCSDKLLKDACDGNDAEKAVLSIMVKNSPAYFIWQPKYYDGETYNIYYPLRNRVNRAKSFDFTLKEGLHNCVENIQWSLVEDLSELNYQRSYLLYDRFSRDAFIEEFKFTRTTNFITFLANVENFYDLFSPDGVVAPETIHYAIQRIDVAVKAKEHSFIDTFKSSGSSKEEDMFNQYDLIMHHSKKIKHDSGTSVDKIKTALKFTINDLNNHWPERKYDGSKNMWILKPSNKCRGYGIILMDQYDRIMDHIIRHPENKYLVQKYIERPLLIYNTKFDIRQYFLTFINNGFISVYMYRDCYIKFSSQEFTLHDYHESIHLTNHSIQQYYQNGVRDPRLPPHNMWSQSEFVQYLKKINREQFWKESIYPSMKKNIMAILLASLEETEFEQNTFELNGVDFLIGYDLEVSLLEINAAPDLSFTTPVTKDICSRVMQDIVKVVIDNAQDKSADTGDFELIYECQISRFPLYSHKLQLNIEDLFVKGNKVVQPQVNKSKNSSISKVTSKYKNKIKNGFGANKRKTLKMKSTNSPRRIFETILVQPKVDDVSDYVKNLSNILKSSNTSFVNLNDLKNCLKLTVAELRENEPKSYMNLRGDKLLKSASFSTFSDFQD